MKSYKEKRHCPCAVCGSESLSRSGWFLVVENGWLDRLKVLSWHPVLAEQDQMLSVCSKQHLKILITQWLTQASLQCLPGRELPNPLPCEGSPATNTGLAPAGRLVGELAVHREAVSHTWTGSPEALECILDVLVGELESEPADATVPLVDRVLAHCAGYPLDEVMTDA